VSKKISVLCPDCHSKLVIDAATGAILHHDKPKAPAAGGKTLEGLFADLDEQKERAERVFEQEKAALADRDRLLSERFEEAMKKARESPADERPKRPFDLD
jgi:hypothetical protein